MHAHEAKIYWLFSQDANGPYSLSRQAGQIGEFMKPKVSITERLAGSIQLGDQKLIDEIIESEIWDYDEDLECMADWPSGSEKSDHDEATTRGDEKHTDPSGESLSPIDAVRQWQNQNPGKGDYCKERTPVCDLGIDEILLGIERMKKEKARGDKG